MSAATNHRDPPKVPNHEMIRVIGSGAYGEIWMARSQLGILRAVKIVDRRTFESEKAFEREFEGMARFEPISREHAGFVDILHVGRDDDGEFFYYVMELADDHLTGQEVDEQRYVPKTLKTELARRSRLLADEVLTLGMALSESLVVLHREGLVHRDIKLANIIFVGGRPKIADIGLVAATGQNSFVGTEGYVPPEGPGAAQGDIFSLGKVLYEMAMGKDRMDFPALNTRINELPDRDLLMRLNDVFIRACATELTERYAYAEQMHDDLARIREGRPLIQLGRKRWPLLASALVIAAAIAGGFYLKMKNARGSASFETDPPGAMIALVDGQIHPSPWEFTNLPIGQHSAHVMLASYDPVDVSFVVEAGNRVTLPLVKLDRSRGSAKINCVPAGARFELYDADGKVVANGTLPSQLRNLLTATYTLVARYEGREKKIPLEITRQEIASADVEFAKGKLVINSVPDGAAITLDGKAAGVTPLELTIPDGAHEIRAKYRSWPEITRPVTIDPHEPVNFDLEFPKGSVKIASAPGGAKVYLDGKEIGRVPVLLEDLEPGPVQYEVRLPGYQPYTVKGEVKPGEQMLLGARLTRRAGPMRDQPWENSLGMKFVPVGDVLMGIWLVRVRDFATFCKETARNAPQPDFPQDEFHPVVLVNHDDAQAFCDWLTGKELSAEQLAQGQSYRLPRDKEWSTAAGLPDEGRNTPEERDGKLREFSWGKHWPPPEHAGNFADSSLRRSGQALIPGYHDGFPQTSPVGSFAANGLGLFDMSGNVWQWVMEPYNPTSRWGVMRGGSWATEKQAELSLSYRNVVDPTGREVIYGFRVVLDPGSGI
jgi:serine/threonine protein kinase/formylglycine-generating enzyme required for sulfatase activity